MKKIEGKLSKAVRDANEKGRLGLIIYVVPAYPNMQRYNEVRELLSKKEFVSIIEHTIPVDSSYETANKTIINAHKTALNNIKEEEIADTLATKQPNILVLYKQSVEKMGLENLIERYSKPLDAVLLEWEDEKPEIYYEAFEKAGVENIFVVYPNMPKEEFDKVVKIAPKEAQIYLSCSSMTGGELESLEDIKNCAKKTKKQRPDTTIIAGMGIKNSDDIKILSPIKEIDGIVIGTSFIKLLDENDNKINEFLSEIEKALYR